MFSFAVFHLLGNNCTTKFTVFYGPISMKERRGAPLLGSAKSIYYVNDAPWVTAEFNNVIRLRKKAYAEGDQDRFRYIRNVVNRERALCRCKYYASKVANLKNTKPSQWWSEVKKIAGMTPATHSDDIRSQLHIDGVNRMSNK